MKPLPAKSQDKILEEMKSNEPKMEAQEKYCRKMTREILIWANGQCPKCKKNMFDYYTLEKCMEEYITNCKNCGYSLVE